MGVEICWSGRSSIVFYVDFVSNIPAVFYLELLNRTYKRGRKHGSKTCVTCIFFTLERYFGIKKVDPLTVKGEITQNICKKLGPIFKEMKLQRKNEGLLRCKGVN